MVYNNTYNVYTRLYYISFIIVYLYVPLLHLSYANKLNNEIVELCVEQYLD